MSFTIYGDSNKDGVTDISDVIRTIDVFKGADTSNEEKNILDTNNDGKVDISDVIGVIDIFKGKQTFAFDGTLTKSPISLRNLNLESKTLDLILDTSLLQTYSTIAGIQLYIIGIRLKNFSGDNNGFITSNVNSSINDWIVASNNIELSGQNNWDKKDLSMVYLEANSESSFIHSNKGNMTLCTLHFNSINDKVSFYSDNKYKSMVCHSDSNFVYKFQVVTNSFENLN